MIKLFDILDQSASSKCAIGFLIDFLYDDLSVFSDLFHECIDLNVKHSVAENKLGIEVADLLFN